MIIELLKLIERLENIRDESWTLYAQRKSNYMFDAIDNIEYAIACLNDVIEEIEKEYDK